MAVLKIFLNTHTHTHTHTFVRPHVAQSLFVSKKRANRDFIKQPDLCGFIIRIFNRDFQWIVSP
ncbi:MAG: hypothetical protein LBE79_11410, partial [Tannerella sp.]|nr:hypothetical protein [Tannerella sp.]